jgi:hypothetical protein
MNMKSSTVRGVLVALAIVAMAGVPAIAATTGSLALSGTAPQVLDITVTGVSGYAALALSTDVIDQEIASVVEKSNSKTGYTVVLSSANVESDVLSLNSAATGEKLVYTLKYNRAAVSFSSGSATLTTSATKTLKAGTTKAMTISFSGADANLAEGTYTDTLTFTIAAK